MNKTDAMLLIQRAKEDSDYFHTLIFHPEKIMAELKDTDLSTKASILKMHPSAFLSSMLTPRETKNGTWTCTCTCSPTSR